MSADDDRLDAALERLGKATAQDVDAVRAARIRARCRAAMRRRSLAERLRDATGPFSWRLLEPALVAAVCAVYLTEVVARALSLLGM